MNCDTCKIVDACNRANIYNDYSLLDKCPFYFPIVIDKPVEVLKPFVPRQRFQAEVSKPLDQKETEQRRQELFKMMED